MSCPQKETLADTTSTAAKLEAACDRYNEAVGAEARELIRRELFDLRAQLSAVTSIDSDEHDELFARATKAIEPPKQPKPARNGFPGTSKRKTGYDGGHVAAKYSK
ncbi:MAG: hypothetical protein HOG89_01285 [Candidatus Peribacter sp.]|jgi:hypothetical protein|nr:hypothetical protein [Candidatus Peribacter sp.]MBT4393282.1 hypothetical protein [Candidatus Peribacter sp.]MBT4601177.1 hypothetical protein [Candidatus Peribacter sp.]MBT5148863.1 hypothetical protein [Candidatus Peribacter sp.]MBT5637257.1 hypothetical protein [Candidatus Peribacter sp.]